MNFSQTKTTFFWNFNYFKMAILNKRLLLAVATKVIINRRRPRRYDFQNVRRRFWVNLIFTRRNISGFFVNVIEEIQKDGREMYFR